MLPSGLLLVALGALVFALPFASRPMTPLQRRRWAAALQVGCLAVLLLAVSVGVAGLIQEPL